jgi:PEGA domain
VSEELEPPGTPERPGRLRVALAVATVIALGALLAWWLHPVPPAAPAGAAQAPAETAPAESPSAALSTPAPAKRGRTEPAPAPAEAPPEVTAPAPRPTLRVTSDIDGAFVFVDRRFVGKTPLETTEVGAGHHQVNVSAEGYDGVSQDVDVPDTGAADVNVALKTVRLNAAVDVLHKHALGSCEGQLTADLKGLHYHTSNRDDAFDLPFGQVEVFTLDYLGKTLRVKKRNGRTWNFTTKAANADPLLVFSRAVDKGRARLAKP